MYAGVWCEKCEPEDIASVVKPRCNYAAMGHVVDNDELCAPA